MLFNLQCLFKKEKKTNFSQLRNENDFNNILNLFFKGLTEEILTVQEEIERLQKNFTEDLASNDVDSDMAEQLAMQASLAVLAERMATIHMKATGKQQILEVQ